MSRPQVAKKENRCGFRKRNVNLLLQFKNETTQFKNQTTQARLQKCEFANSIQIAANRARIDGVDLVEVTSVACAAAEGTLVALLANLARIAGHPGADCSNPARTTGWAFASDLPRLSNRLPRPQGTITWGGGERGTFTTTETPDCTRERPRPATVSTPPRANASAEHTRACAFAYGLQQPRDNRSCTRKKRNRD